jgi:hypothetical protein
MNEQRGRDLCKCGEPHDGWPGRDGGALCQMCWEVECSDSWWAMWNGRSRDVRTI